MAPETIDVSKGDVMGELDWIRSHVERCMQEVWADAHLERDEDGDYRFRSATGPGWIRINGADPVVVLVCVMAAVELRPSLALLKEINELNAHTAPSWCISTMAT